MVADYLKTLDKPFVLLGDFNDVPDSRTLKLLSAGTVEAKKPAEDRFTFSAIKPQTEIDFIFASPATSWEVEFCKVMNGQQTSDHRPVVAVLSLTEPE